MRQYGLYIFDLDGTLYRGAEALPGAKEVVSQLRSNGSLVRFLTNNSSQTPDAQAEKLARMGIPANADEILTSGVGAARHLAEQKLSSVFVVGEPGLVEVLNKNRIEVVEDGGDCKAVVVGICRDFTYDLMVQAMHRIQRGARFVATNTDATYPLERGKLIPGAGAIVASIETCTGAHPFVIGKPNPYLIRMLMSDTGVPPEETLVIGDRYETDIVAGESAGCDTVLVLTGVTREPLDDTRSVRDLRSLLPEHGG